MQVCLSINVLYTASCYFMFLQNAYLGEIIALVKTLVDVYFPVNNLECKHYLLHDNVCRLWPIVSLFQRIVP